MFHETSGAVGLVRFIMNRRFAFIGFLIIRESSCEEEARKNITNRLKNFFNLTK